MACLELPDVPLPRLPSPFSIEPPPLPAISVNLAFCCKLPTLELKVPIVIPPLTLNPAVIATINAALDIIDAYQAAIPLDCPRE